MKRFLILIAASIFVVSTTLAQSPRTLPQSQPSIGRQRPQLQQATPGNYKDELAKADDRYFYYRSGFGISLPQTEGSPLLLGLDSSLSTNGMVGVVLHRNLPVRAPIQTPNVDLYSVKDALVETRIMGHESGVKNQAILIVEPYLLEVEVNSLIDIGEKDGLRVYLKPGKWKFQLSCSLESIEVPDGGSWKAKRNSESVIKGGKYKFQGSSSSDHFSGLLYIQPFGTVAYGLSQLGGLVGFFFHRPDIKLPATTELHFRIESMEATYVAPPAPKGPVTIIR